MQSKHMKKFWNEVFEKLDLIETPDIDTKLAKLSLLLEAKMIMNQTYSPQQDRQ